MSDFLPTNSALRDVVIGLGLPHRRMIETEADALVRYAERLAEAVAPFIADAEKRGGIRERAVYDFVMACIEGDRFKDSMGETADWYVRYSLGQSALVYHVDGWDDTIRDAERRGAVQGAKEIRRLRTSLLAIANVGDGSEHLTVWQRIARIALDASAERLPVPEGTEPG